MICPDLRRSDYVSGRIDWARRSWTRWSPTWRTWPSCDRA